MAEKRGHLEKMMYDFPTEAVLEVCIKGKWYRVTSREFRSFDGKRRYTKPERQPSQGMKDLKDITPALNEAVGAISKMDLGKIGNIFDSLGKNSE